MFHISQRRWRTFGISLVLASMLSQMGSISSFAETNSQTSSTQNPISTPISNPIITPDQQQAATAGTETIASIPLIAAMDYSVYKDKGTKDPKGRKVYLADDYYKSNRIMQKAIEKKIAELPKRLFDFDYYEIKSSNSDGDWIKMSIGILGIPQEVVNAINNKTITDWGTPLEGVLAQKQKDGSWKVAIEHSNEFLQMGLTAPDSLISPAYKDLFRKEQAGTLAIQQATFVQSVNYKWPWTSGVGWSLGNGGWHTDLQGRTCPRVNDPYYCALDFFIKTDGDDNYRLLTASNGVVTNVCATGAVTRNIEIYDSDGIYTDYWHIDKDTLDKSVYNTVYLQQGTVMGRVRRSSFGDTCGIASQQSTSAHVHWKFPWNTPITVDGTVVSYTQNLPAVGATYTSSNTPIYLCQAPPASGTWYIDSSCYISASKSTPGSVEVRNYSTLSIIRWAELDIKFIGNQLLIRPGSKVYIENGSVIR